MREYLFPKILFLLTAALWCWQPLTVRAVADLKLSPSSIRFASSNFVSGQTATVYVDVDNLGDQNASGIVNIFLNTNQLLEGGLAVSVVPHQLDTVFAVFTVPDKDFRIYAQIKSALPSDTDLSNNEAISELKKVDIDTDGDGIGNSQDTDDDNDGLSDSDELSRGTNPLKADTDGDGYNDRIDAFPTNSSEWLDTDGDGQGNNADQDDDNDGVPDTKEFAQGTDPLKSDTDGDGYNDAVDTYPLDRNRWKVEKAAEKTVTPATTAENKTTTSAQPVNDAVQPSQPPVNANSNPTTTATTGLEEASKQLDEVVDSLKTISAQQKPAVAGSLFRWTNPFLWLVLVALGLFLILLLKIRLTFVRGRLSNAPTGSRQSGRVAEETVEIPDQKTTLPPISESAKIIKKTSIIKKSKPPVHIQVKKIKS